MVFFECYMVVYGQSQLYRFISCIFKILLFNSMIESVFKNNQSPTQSFYFQLYPVNLHLLQGDVPTSESKFKFSVFKGQQKFDENKISTDGNFMQVGDQNIMAFRGSQLNFYLPSFNKLRKILFTLKLAMTQNGEQFDAGQLKIDPQNYINEFRNNGTTRFQQKIDISEMFSLEFEMYIQKSRFALQKNVKEHKPQRIMKSPVRQRQQLTKNQDTVTSSAKKSLGQKAVSSPASKKEIQQVRKQQPVQESQPPQQEKQVSAKQSRQSKTAKKVQQKPEVSQSRQQPAKKGAEQKSERSETIISPVVKTKQMAKTQSARKPTLRSSQRLSHEVATDQSVPAFMHNETQGSFAYNLKMFVGLALGIMVILFVMSPTSKI